LGGTIRKRGTLKGSYRMDGGTLIWTKTEAGAGAWLDAVVAVDKSTVIRVKREFMDCPFI
jgi:hypothetical protein